MTRLVNFVALAISLSLGWTKASSSTLIRGNRNLEVYESQQLKPKPKPKPYNQQDIMTTVRKFDTFPTRVLIYDGENDVFKVYNLEHADKMYPEQTLHCGRCSQALSLVVEALKTNQPQRFARGQPPLQMLFRVADAPRTQCMNHPALCDAKEFAPILSFGSVARDVSLIPSDLAYPNGFYVTCMYEWRFNGATECDWKWGLEVTNDGTPVDGVTREWNELIPQVIWRGSDYHTLVFVDLFEGMGAPSKKVWPEEGGQGVTKKSIVNDMFKEYNRLTPRWKAVALSLEAELDAAERSEKEQGTVSLPWIDCKFYGGVESAVHDRYSSAGINVRAEEFMGSGKMSDYKYLIDLGGGGGTTWRGTLSKLGMPGLLFHHETPTKDWFFDLLIPYVHYVPIKFDLSDLKEKFEWAEAHQEQARDISRAATELYVRILSKEYMSELYDELFINTLNDVANAYMPMTTTENETLDSILQKYRDARYVPREVATCDQESCAVVVRSENLRSVKSWA